MRQAGHSNVCGVSLFFFLRRSFHETFKAENEPNFQRRVRSIFYTALHDNLSYKTEIKTEIYIF